MDCIIGFLDLLSCPSAHPCRSVRQMTMTLHIYRPGWFQWTWFGVNPPSGCRVPASTMFQEQLSCLWACPCGSDEQKTVMLHTYRPRWFHWSWLVMNQLSGCWVTVSANLSWPDSWPEGTDGDNSIVLLFFFRKGDNKCRWQTHDDVIKWKHFPRYWPFSLVNSPHKASDAELWCFLWSASWINGGVNNREAGDLGRHLAHHDITVMQCMQFFRECQWVSARKM